MEKTHSDSPVTKCKIIATGIALPSTCVTSAELDSRFGKAVGYVEKRCGIVHRYHASLHDSQAGLAAQALHQALKAGSLAPSSIDLLICASALALSRRWKWPLDC